MGICGSKEASAPRPVGAAPSTNRTATTPSKPTTSTTTAKTTPTPPKSAGIKSETRRLGTKNDDVPPAPAPTSKPTTQLSNEQVIASKPAPVTTNTRPSGNGNSAREMAARAAEKRLDDQKKKGQQGELGKKLEIERKKNHKDYALEEYESKNTTK